MNVLVTGHKGFIGCHLVEELRQAGHSVTGCDIGYFADCAWDPIPRPHNEWHEDFRAITIDRLRDFDCIYHLAAISNDPMGDLDQSLTYAINQLGSVELAQKAKQAGVSRFLFAGSCSVYGKGEQDDLDEEAPLNPLSAYAKSKVNTEVEVKKLADDSFCPIFLRNATAYGYSPMLRIDLVVNNLLACATAKGEIRIKSDGTPWRPLIHCKDIARAFLALSEAPREAVFNQSINIGANHENYQVRDVGDIIQKALPESTIIYTGEVGYDPRNYKVNFDKLYSILPSFRLEYSVETGVAELFQSFKEKSFSVDDFEGKKYVRLRALKDKISR